MSEPVVLVGELLFDSLDDGGEALITALVDEADRDASSGVWVRVISNLGDERVLAITNDEGRDVVRADHARLDALIGRRVRVVIEPLDG